MRLLVCIAFSLALTTCDTQAQQDFKNELNQTVTMKDFSLLVRVPITYTTEDAKTVGAHWDELLAKWKRDKVYVVSFAFPGKSHVITGPEKELTTVPVLSDNLRVVSNIVLRLPSIEDAIALAKEFPILAYGGSVEVREIPAGLNFQPVK
jgi:hypothetical protein